MKSAYDPEQSRAVKSWANKIQREGTTNHWKHADNYMFAAVLCYGMEQDTYFHIPCYKTPMKILEERMTLIFTSAFVCLLFLTVSII